MTLLPRIRAREGPNTDELARVPGDGMLGQVPARLAPDRTAHLVCGYCSVGCSLEVHLRNGRPVNLSPSPDYPVNRGMACPKGWEALAPLGAADRLTDPLVRDRHGRLVPTDWDTALDTFVTRVRAIHEQYGPSAFAYLSTGQMPTEELALLGLVAKSGLGVVHGDGNTRQCMATSVVAHKQAFGFDAPPYTYADLELSDTVVLIGSNLAVAHPILWDRLARNRRDPAVVVVDPRRTETAMGATHHVALAPKSDLVWLYGLARLLIERGWVDHDFVRDHTSGFAAFAAHVEGYSLDRVAEATGCALEAIEAVADTFAPGRRVSLWWTMGVNQSHQAVRTAQAIIDLALLTGNIGKPGTGANSITGQCNAMGSRMFSNTASLYAGRDFTDPDDRAEVADALGIDVARVPAQPSWAYDQIVDGIATGAIRGLWVIATNSAHSWINHGDLHELLGRLDFLVVQDLYGTTETARRADLVLAAAGWGEKSGTFINSERRVGVIEQVADPPGRALADFTIFRRIAEAWGCADLIAEWSTPAQAFAVLQRLSAGRPCDLTGIDGYRHLRAAGGIQWPYPAADASTHDTAAIDLGSSNERRLFADGVFFTPDGRARFVFDTPRPPPERPDATHPLALLTGRGSSAQWHTLTRTGKSPILRSLSPSRTHVEIHPEDAAARGIATGDEVEVRSRRGAMGARVLVTPTVPAGSVFVPMHDPAVNRLTFPAVDPESRQPAYKYCAVEVSGPLPHPLANATSGA